MGARPPPRFLEANAKIFNFHHWCPSRFITFAYCAPQIFMPPPAHVHIKLDVHHFLLIIFKWLIVSFYYFDL